MEILRAPLRFVFDRAERLLGLVFPPHWNPMLNLGALGFFFYWIITVSGIYIYIFFDTGVTRAYESVAYMTHDQWYAAGIMRSLHRYASDGLIVVMLLHIAREFALDRYRGVRWFSWITGVPVLVMVYVAGITGYWLVWDRLAQYVAIVTTEWLDRLPIFGEPIARNFLSPANLESRFFTLMVFMHIAIPLIALILLWIHLQRVSKPRINPPRGLAIGTLASLLALSLVHPALSQGPADLAKVVGPVGLDWFYLPLYPLLENWPGPVTWGGAGALLLMFCAIPWLPPLRKPPVASVDLPNCNGCMRCFNDCPYNAISMRVRSDGLPFEREAVVEPSLCVSCGICAGACPTATPFRRASELVSGIDLPDMRVAELREEIETRCAFRKGEPRILIFGCDHGVSLRGVDGASVKSISLRCAGQLPPSFIDYVLSKRLADGVVLTGCAENSCHARYGIQWTDARLARERDPMLRARVPRDRIRVLWAGRAGRRGLDALLRQFAHDLSELSSDASPVHTPDTRERPKELVNG
ncbi:MAG: cytochrome b N-terminal domain-containing protein [Hyphomicrobiaceae bacterium]|nr:cytochrome b N-terminal domain-containing protein [Hyphomicrobiaceae bacterium]